MIDTGTHGAFRDEDDSLEDGLHILDQAHQWSQLRRTRLESIMIDIMNVITDKRRWGEKIWDPEICQRWTKEIKVQLSAADTRIANEYNDMRNGPFYWGPEIDEKAATFIIEELKHKSSDSDVSDTLIHQDFRKHLVDLVHELEESIPVDWHPGRHKVVRDLVHPSMYPLQYGKTTVCNDSISIDTAFTYAGQGNVIHPPDPAEGYSQNFQWLPADVKRYGDGFVFTSYINNLDPSHESLYNAIAELVKYSVPLWQECVASHRENKPRRVPCDDEEALWIVEENKRNPPPFRFAGDGYTAPFDQAKARHELRMLGRQKWYTYLWQPVCPVFVWPAPQDFISWRSEMDKETVPSKINLTTYSFTTGLQVIVKISSIHLTPENPTFDGSALHVEGMANEHICATSIYYYDCHNITSARVAFSGGARMGLCSYGQDDYRCLEHVYGTGLSGQPTTQDFGAVTTPQGRILAFPNVFHHRLLPFELADKTKPGHRKVVVLWLVNPQKRIISTANVPPQQPDAYQRMVDDLRQSHDSVTVERMLSTRGKPVSIEEARDARFELMAERKRDESDQSLKQHLYSFCEH